MTINWAGELKKFNAEVKHATTDAQFTSLEDFANAKLEQRFNYLTENGATKEEINTDQVLDMWNSFAALLYQIMRMRTDIKRLYKEHFPKPWE